MDILYQTQATAIGGREGSAASVDGVLRVRLAIPEALGGQGGQGTTPEQLFAAGYAACFLSAIRHAAAREQATITNDANVTATVGLGARDDSSGFRLTVTLEVDLPGLEREVAKRIVEAASWSCPYSNAAREGIDVRLSLA